MTGEAAEILFIELLGGIGDLLIALPAIHALALSHPQARVTVLTFPPAGELLRHDPLVGRVLYARRSTPSRADSRLQAADVRAALARFSFDTVVSDTMYGGIDRLVERCGAVRCVSNLWRQPPSEQRVGDRFLAILAEEGLIAPEHRQQPLRLVCPAADREWAQAWKEQHLAPHRPVLLLNSGAGMVIKRPHPHTLLRVAEESMARWQAQVMVQRDEHAAAASAPWEALGSDIISLPKLPLPRFAALAALADACVSADTGPARIAAAVGVPTVTLFGPSWAGRYGLPPPHINLQGFAGCPERHPLNFTSQRCWFSGRCPFPDRRTCVDDIPSAQILAAVARLLAEQC